MTFNDFVCKHKLKIKATSNVKIYEVMKQIGLDSKVGIYLRDGSFSSDIGIVNLHPSKETHWVCCRIYNSNEFYTSPILQKTPSNLNPERIFHPI